MPADGLDAGPNLSGAYSPGLIEAPGAYPRRGSRIHAYPGLIAPASLKLLQIQVPVLWQIHLSGAYSPGLIEAWIIASNSDHSGQLIRGL